MAKNAATVGERLRLLLANDPAEGQGGRVSVAVSHVAVELCRRPHRRSGGRRALHRRRPCAPASTGSWGRLRCGTRLECAETVARMKALGIARWPRVESCLLATGRGSWYSPDRPDSVFNPRSRRSEPIPSMPGHARVADFRRTHGVVRSNAGASLVDLGDGIGCIELHSLKNAIGGDVLSMISAVLNPASDAVRDFAGFVICGRPRQLQRGRQPDAAAAAGAGGRVGRGRRASFTASSR